MSTLFAICSTTFVKEKWKYSGTKAASKHVGAKRNCNGAQSLVQSVSPIKLTQLYQDTQLEVRPNFYSVCSALYTSKLSVNLMEQKLLIKRWWNCHLVGMVEAGVAVWTMNCSDRTEQTFWSAKEERKKEKFLGIQTLSFFAFPKHPLLLSSTFQTTFFHDVSLT